MHHALALATAAHAQPWHLWTPRHMADLAILGVCALILRKSVPAMFRPGNS